MPNEIRLFNGLAFRISLLFPVYTKDRQAWRRAKSHARSYADERRKEGYDARVVKLKRGYQAGRWFPAYVVYVRKRR